MGTQMSSARRGIATDEMKQVAKDEDFTLDTLVRGIARGSIIIPKNIERKQEIKVVGIGQNLKTKVNVNIGTSTRRRARGLQDCPRQAHPGQGVCTLWRSSRARVVSD